MVFDTPSHVKLQAICKRVVQVAALGAMGVTLYGLYLFLPDRSLDVSFHPEEPTTQEQPSCSLALDAKEEFHLPSLDKQFALIGVSTRPDGQSGEERILLHLKESGDSAMVSPGERVSLYFDNGSLRFSDYATPLWLKAEPQHGGVDLTTFLWLPVEGKEKVITDKASFHLPLFSKKEVVEEFDRIPEEALEAVRKMEWWGKDELFQRYGGEEYADRMGKERLVLGGDVLFVDKGDLLVWTGRRWEKKKATEGSIVMRVRSTSPVEVEVWGREGVSRHTHTFAPPKEEAPSIKMAETMTRVRQHTSSRISCKLGQKNVILKNGDWILHEQKSWRVLRTLDEINRYLSHKLSGELFIFDGVDKEEGKGVIKGHIFNKTRSLATAISFPIHQKEKKNNSRHFMRHHYMMDDFDDDFDDDDDDFNDENDEYMHLMNARRHHGIPDDY